MFLAQMPAMFAMEVSASNFCARDTRGTSAKFKTFADTFKDVNDIQNEMSIFLGSYFAPKLQVFEEKKIGEALANRIHLIRPVVGPLATHLCHTCSRSPPA